MTSMEETPWSYYSLIAFDERVTFCLQRVRSLPCACVYVAFFARRLAYNHYAIAHAYNAANAHTQDSDRARWSQKSYSLVEGNRNIGGRNALLKRTWGVSNTACTCDSCILNHIGTSYIHLHEYKMKLYQNDWNSSVFRINLCDSIGRIHKN